MFKSIVTHLSFWVLLALLSGIGFGHYFPSVAVEYGFLGTLFIDTIKLFIPPVIFFTIVLGLTGMNDLKHAGKIGLKAFVYFEIVTTFALLMGIGTASLFRPGDINKNDLQRSATSTLSNSNSNGIDWWIFLQNNLTLQILIAAVFAGILLSRSNYKEMLIPKLQWASDITFKGLKYIMYLSPIGAFGGISYAVGKYGLKSIVPLAGLMATMYLTMILFVWLILGFILRLYGFSILKLLKEIKEEILLVFATSSSETALPGLMKKLEKFGCKKSVIGLVVPSGYSFNLDGTSIYLSMAILFLAQLYQVELTWTDLLSILGILMITSKGAAGVSGSGFIILASTLSVVPKIPIEGLAFLLGIDKFMSEARALTNLIGNAVATMVIDKSEK